MGKEREKEDPLELRFRELYRRDQELPPSLREDYEILSCLHWQGEQQVYLLQDGRKRRFILKRASGAKQDILKREAEKLRDLCFPFLPRFLSWTEEAGAGWLLREYIPGDTLWERVEREGSLDTSEAGLLIGRLCEMTAKLHESDPPVIHRDLKPQNIVLSSEENLYFIDMGTAREFRTDAEYDTVFMGTRQTAAPEQYGYRQTDCRTDVYALGMIYQYLLTGSLARPGTVETGTGTARTGTKSAGLETESVETGTGTAGTGTKPARLEKGSVGSGAKPAGTGAGMDLPPLCREVIEKCTAMDPENRYQNCRELKEAVLAIDGEAHGSVPDRRGRRRRLVAALAAGVLSLLAVSGIWKYVDWKFLPYHFHSELIEQAVRMQLGKVDEEAVHKEELAQIKELRICGSHVFGAEDEYWHQGYTRLLNGSDISEDYGSIRELTDCSYMFGLQTLILDQQRISDLTPLKNLPIETLSLCKNPINDFFLIASMNQLRQLDVACTPFDDLAVLETLPELKTLDISDTQVRELEPLASMNVKELIMRELPTEALEELKKLPLRKLVIRSYNRDTEEMIGQMTSLEKLSIYNYHDTTLEPLADLSNLYTLDLYGGSLRELDGIEQFANLEELFIAHTDVSDSSCLENMRHLTSLVVENTEIQDFSPVLNMKQLRWMRIDEGQEAALDETVPNPWFSVDVAERVRE